LYSVIGTGNLYLLYQGFSTSDFASQLWKEFKSKVRRTLHIASL